jgi:hypothetical protein
MAKSKTINVKGTNVSFLTYGVNDYISLTDIAKSRNNSEPFAVINNWMRSRSTIEFIGLWEKLCNPDFKPLEFERFKNEAGKLSGLNRFETTLVERLVFFCFWSRSIWFFIKSCPAVHSIFRAEPQP